MRTLAIGDIHGAHKALEQVLRLAAATKDDRLIFLGDYVDGWSGSAQVIDMLIDLSVKMDCVFIKGNHDVWCQQWLDNGTSGKAWYASGGKSTIDSYRDYDEDTKMRHLGFLDRLQNFYIDEDNRLFIHAGFSSMHGPENEQHLTNYSWDRTLWEMALAMDKSLDESSLFYPRRLKLYKEIYIGHTPTINYGTDQPIHAANLWNLDTGAAFNGRLTLMDIDTKQYWQSDAVQTLYPGETGRNKT